MSESSPQENPAKARRIPVPARRTGLLAVSALCVIIAGTVYAVTDSSPGGRPAAANAAHSVLGAPGQKPATVPGPMPGAPSTQAGQGSTGTAGTGTAGTGTAGRGTGSAGTDSAKDTAAGPKPLHPGNASLVASWKKGTGGAALSAVTLASGSVMMSHSASLYPEMLQSCRSLATAVRQASAASPIPDGAMQREYTAALSSFRQGVADCVAGIVQHIDGPEDTVTNVNKAQVGQAVSAISAGLTDLYVATEVLRKQ
jgi:hypothetical protein